MHCTNTTESDIHALVAVSPWTAKHLVAAALAQRLRNTPKRVYIAYGSTNQCLLELLNIPAEGYVNGYVDTHGLGSNKQRPEVIVLNGTKEAIIDDMSSNDIIIKGANALSFEHGRYEAAVAAASPQGGTFGAVVTKAACVGAELIIPVTHEKLVPSLMSGRFSQNSFRRTMGLPVSLLKYTYGHIFTEIEAFSELFGVHAEPYLSGGIDGMAGGTCFVLTGEQSGIIAAENFIKAHGHT